MTISWLQARIFGLLVCLCSNSCTAGRAIGNYMIGRLLAGGPTYGLIMGNVPLDIACSMATQLVYIASVTPGGTVSADVRAISHTGIPLAMIAISSRGLSSFNSQAANMVKSLGILVGTIGSVLFYSVASLNLAWQSFGWEDIENNKLDRLYTINFGWPRVSHSIFSFLSTALMAHSGVQGVAALHNVLPMGGIPMKALFIIGAMLLCAGIAILFRQIVNKSVNSILFLVGFTLAASLKLNLVSITVVSLLFAVVMYEIKTSKGRTTPVAASTSTPVGDDDKGDEDT